MDDMFNSPSTKPTTINITKEKAEKMILRANPARFANN
jgi:hypothetical protein